MFKISDKVVCVDTDNWLIERAGPCPEVGGVYVVDGVETIELIDCVMLVGFGTHTEEHWYGAWRFRKLEDIKEENRKKQEEPQLV